MTYKYLIKYIFIVIILIYIKFFKMSINKNVTLVILAVVMSLAMWMMPETISAQTHAKRLLQLNTYNTNPVRTDTVKNYCAGTSRTELISSGDTATAQEYKNALTSQLKINGNKFINSILGGGDIMSEITAGQTALGLFIGFFALGFIIFLVQWTCLCCCCCCPGCCPSKCCQKDQNEQYTKCELYWPSIFLILLLLLIIITSAIGLSKSSTFKKGINDLQCSTSILFDDIINGNVTADGKSFFTGVTKLTQSLTNLNSQIGVVNTQMAGLNTALTGVVANLNTAKANIDLVPTGAAGGTADIKYNSKISDPSPIPAANIGKIKSTLNSLLGSSTSGTGIVGGFYQAISTTHATLSGIATDSNGFATNSGANLPSSTITNINNDLTKVSNQILDLDKSLKNGLQLMDTPKSIGGLVISLIYGVALGLSVLTLLGVILMTFCDKYKCRYLMYFSCVILFFIGLVGFLIALLFSVVVPVLFFLCEWLDVTITSSGFNANTQKLLSDAQTRNILSTCLVGGTGDIMTAVGGATVTSTLNQLKNSFSNTANFNTASQVTTINAAVTNITNTINAFRDGLIPDVTDYDSILALQTVANSQLGGTCAETAVDSFVLSMANTTLIGCSITAATVNPGVCSAASFNVLAATTPCRGCIDTTLMLNQYYSALNTAGDWKTTVLDVKYTAVCAGAWKTYFGNVWDNYYRFKILPVKQISDRWTLPTVPSITAVTTSLTAVNATLTGIITNLRAAVDSVIDPQFGMLAGLNCRIIGQDLKTMVSSICVSNFITIYITRLVMGISAFGILFAMCCIVCSGVRHYKHSQRKERISPNFFGDKNSFENTDAAFKP